MTFGRLVHYFHPERHCAGFKASSIAKYFVWADVASFLVQGGGGSLLNPGNDAEIQKIGLKVYMAGVGVQEGFIVSAVAQFKEEITDILQGCVHHSGRQICARHVSDRTARSCARGSNRLAPADVDHIHGPGFHYSLLTPSSRTTLADTI